MEPFLIHNHTSKSNLRLRDSINKPEEMIEYAYNLGLPGLCLTEHASLSSHVETQKFLDANKEKYKDFKIGYGNEVYLVDKEKTKYAKENNESMKFYHFILLAKNNDGYLGLKELSTKEWENSFFFKGMERTPTYYDELEEFMKDYKGDIIASSACVGGELPQLLIKYYHDKTEDNKKEIHDYITWLIKVFGKEDLYLELQPSHSNDQRIANEMLLNISKAYDLTPIVTTDAHYLNKQQAKIHKIYLQASEGEREVDEFYATTYIMDAEEIHDYMDRYIGKDIVDDLIKNTYEIKDKIEPIDFYREVQVPKAKIEKFEPLNITQKFDYKYEYIKKFRESELEINRYYLYLIESGLQFYNQEINLDNLDRINTELKHIWLISEKLKQPLSSYFVLTKEVVDIMWETSLVGVARGSAACFYTNYLLGIVQINPLDYDLPYWRFLHYSRVELPDIDLDTESSQRENVIQLVKENFGKDKVINMGTFTTEGPRSTVITACRGLGIDVDISHNLSNMVPMEKTEIWSIKDCLEGNEKKGRKPVKSFIEEVEKYPNLKETMLSIEGITSGRSQHASGTIIYPDRYVNYNAMMKTKKGLEVTQFNAEDTTSMGGLKLDFLSISGLSRIRKAMDLLLEAGKIEWQGSLRKTYNKYFHPDVIDIENKDMFNDLFKGEVFDAFQMDSPQGKASISKIKPQTFEEVSAANALMRLTTEGEQPIDKYVRYKKDLSEWYRLMEDYGLNKDEINKIKKHLDSRYGICDTQELLMSILIDENIANASMEYANKFRKVVARKNQDEIAKEKEVFYRMMKDNNQSEKFTDYIWYECFSLQFGYSFSKPHIVAYTMILMIEMNITHFYGAQYWKTACLSINAGLDGDLEKGTNYGIVSKAVNSMKENIELPDINQSKMEFVPTEDGKVMFGLKAIAGLGVDAIEILINNRPYENVSDFYNKNIKTGLMPISKLVVLIKAGAFHNLNNSHRDSAIELVNNHIELRDKLTTVQLPKISNEVYQSYPKFRELINMYNFRNSIKGRNKKPMNEKIEKYFMQHFSDEVEYKFNDDGILEIDIKSFEKMYNKEIKPLKEWLKSEKACLIFQKNEKKQFWVENFSGTPESWEMETIMFYSDKHEVDYIPFIDQLKIVNFNNMKQEDVRTTYTTKNGIVRNIFNAENIIGTVVDKNKPKSLIYLLTQYGVITVRVPKYKFGIYNTKAVKINNDNTKEIVDDSWFNRGTLLLCSGYRRGDEFILYKSNKNTKEIYKIENQNNQYYLNDNKITN